MNQLTCVIIEDDPISIEMITALSEKSKLITIVNVFTSAQDAMRWMALHQVELLFLDIELPDLSGLDFLRAMVHRPAVIITSGNPQYALDAFEFDVVDFLVKPIKDYSRFITAVNRVLVKRRDFVQQEDKSLFVKIDSLLLKLNTDEILWIEASGDYIKIQTEDKLHTVYSTLKKIEEKISNKDFIRVHRSFIVNLTKIANIDPNNLLIDKRVIPVSSTYKEALLKRISVL